MIFAVPPYWLLSKLLAPTHLVYKKIFIWLCLQVHMRNQINMKNPTEEGNVTN